MKKIFGFTLAEILLAMTIVGVVAAMTIPNLYYSRLKREYSTKLKKFYSNIENAFVALEADNGYFREMSAPTSLATAYNWYITNLDPYIGHEYLDSTNSTIYFKDGSKLVMDSTPSDQIEFYYDVNGDKGPNAKGKDQFYFDICYTDASREAMLGNKDIFFGPAQDTEAVTRDDMISNCENDGIFCARLLQNDQWEFKRDYPFPIR